MTTPAPVILFEKDKIQKAVEQIAESVAAWARKSSAQSLALISVLEGAKPFTRDLTEALKRFVPEVKVLIHEIHVKGTEGTVLLKDREWRGDALKPEAVRGQLALIADDLADSGKTIEMLRECLRGLNPSEIKTAVLVRKFGAQSGPVDFCGFDLNLDRKALAQRGLKDYWLFGYGMDWDGGQRELDHILWVEIK